MKILYIAKERSDAEVAATALRGIAQNVTVLWASHVDRAAKWIHENRDLAALVVETPVDIQSCTSLLKHVRSLALRAAIVVVAPEEAAPRLESLQTGAFDYVAKNESLLRNLPVVVKRAIERAQTLDPWRSNDLHVGTVAESAARDRVGRQPDQALTNAGETQRLDAGFGRPRDNERRPKEPIEQERASREMLNRRHAERQNAEQRHAPDMTAAAARVSEQPTKHDASLATAMAARDALAQTLAQTQAALDRAERARASDAAAAADRLAQCQSEFDARLADAVGNKSALERRLGELEASLHQREQSWAVGQSAAAERQTKLEGLVHQERATRASLEQKLAQASAALQDAEQRHRSVMTAAAEQLAERQAQYEVGMARAAATWDMVDEQLREAAIEVKRARQDQATAAADVDRLSHRESERSFLLDELTAAHSTLKGQLAAAEAALDAANERAARERLTAAEQAKERQTEFQTQLELEVERRQSVEQKLALAETARDDAEERHASAVTTAAALLAERQARFDAELTEAAGARNAVAQQTRDLEAALGGARQELESSTAATERLTRREVELTSMLAEATATRNTIERRLAGTETAFKDADERATHERLAASKRAAEREAELDGLIRQERAARANVEQKLAQAEGALGEAEQRHASAMTAAATELAERQAQFDTELWQIAAARDGLKQQLSDAEVAVNGAQHDHVSVAAEVERLTRREAELVSQLADAAASRNTLELQLIDSAIALKDADERATHERLAASKRAAEREAELDGLIRQERATRVNVERLTRREAELVSQLAELSSTHNTVELQLIEAATALKDADERATLERSVATKRQSDVEVRLSQEIKRREALEGEIAETRSAAADAGRGFREEAAAMTARAREIEDQIARERLDQESRLAEMEEQIGSLALERDALRGSLDTSYEQSQRANTEHREEREGLERARLAAEAEVRRLAAEHTEARHNLEEARRTFQETLDRDSGEHASALATLVASVADRDRQIEEQAARHLASLQAAESERAQFQEGFQTTLAARSSEIEQLQGKLKAAIQELDVARSRREVLQTEADRVPQLQKQLDESRAEMCRQFDDSPLALCRCTPGGALTHANRAFAVLVDYRKADELRSADFATTVFESPDDLSWLIERCLSTRAIESIETTWRRMNGGGLPVRLSAFASASDVIEVVAEDITNLRALQDRLGQAHRMEAVGRLASEVAITCGNLLLDVHQDAQQWLMTVGSNTALRHQGEMLLDEVTRAASFLRQLAAYSDEETNALAPVDLTRVLRDLEPVLKRVAGDNVELELPKTSSPIEVDVKAERVERLLVNLAGYGRERMPMGGRLRVEVTTVVVDRRFIAKYPNVRQGPHALITVTEVKRAMRGEGLLQLRDWPTEPSSNSLVSERPGVDLGALQGLIRECGGHLWMAVEPPGDMVVKIHLPMCASDDRTPPRTSAIRTSRGHTMAAGLVTDFHH